MNHQDGSRKGATFAIAMTVGLLLGGVASASAGRALDDTAITTKVKAELVGDKAVSALKVHVETYKGEVQLNGNVATEEQKAAAEADALKVEGVTKVVNNLTVGKTSRSAGTVIDDSTITTKVKAEFVGSSIVKASQIDVTTKDGVVTLSGFASTKAAKTEAERIAKRTKGVHSVENNVEVRT